MKNFKFKIYCEGLSRKRTNQLADDLSMWFAFVHNAGEIIIADKPVGKDYYNAALDIIDRYGVDYSVADSDSYGELS